MMLHKFIDESIHKEVATSINAHAMAYVEHLNENPEVIAAITSECKRVYRRVLLERVLELTKDQALKDAEELARDFKVNGINRDFDINDPDDFKGPYGYWYLSQIIEDMENG